MPVNYTPPTPEQLLPVAGAALGTAAARIKNWSRDDLLLVSLAPGTQAAGVFTQNRFCAAPVTICREHLAHAGSIRALVVNAGNANAGTGERGLADARDTCAAYASSLYSASRYPTAKDLTGPGAILFMSAAIALESTPPLRNMWRPERP